MALNQSFNQDSNGNMGLSAFVTTASPSYTTSTQQSLSLTPAGAVRTDSSGTTQPISASSLPLPTGASTSGLQTTGNTTLSTISTTLTAISGQLPTTLGQKTSVNSFAVVLASDETVPVALPVSSTATLTSVASSASSVTLLAASGTTKSWIIVNDSTSILYVAFSATATTSAYTSKMFPNAQLSSDLTYTGVISGIWATANGSARVTQLT